MTDEEQRIMDMLKQKLAPIEKKLKDNDGKPTPDMQESMDLYNNNQEELQKLIEEKRARGDSMYTGSMGFVMDEEIFAKIQEHQCGFNGSMGFEKMEGKKLQEKLSINKELQLSFEESITLLFMKTFGCYGQKKEIDIAIEMTKGFLEYILKLKPNTANTRQNDDYMGWLSSIGKLNILLGTMYAYKQETIKSCYYFMKGLKTEMVQMNTPYTDFIRYMLSKLDEIEKENYSSDGIGYIAENPMGSVDRNKRMLVSHNALNIIPELVNDNGDILVCHNGFMGLYGHLIRVRSTGAEGIPERIDVYETLLIDKDFSLKKIEFYWNGYFESGFGGKVLLPIGFRIKKQSKYLDDFEFVTNKNRDTEILAESAPY